MKRTLLFIAYLLLSLSGNAKSANNWIRQMAQDGENLWLATNSGGLVKHNKQTGENTIYTTSNSGLCSDYLRSVTCHGGKVLVGSDNDGVSEFDGSTFKTYNEKNAPFKHSRLCFEEVIYDADGNMWLGGQKYIYKYDGTTWEDYTLPEAASSSWLEFSVLKFSTDRTLWFGTEGPNFDGSVGYITKDKEMKTIFQGTHDIYGMDIDKLGRVWYSCSSCGLYCYDGSNRRLFAKNESAYYGLCIDDDNNVWFGCDNLLYKYDGTAFTSYQVPTNGDVYDLLLDGNAIWVAVLTTGELFRFEDGQFESIDYTTETTAMENGYHPMLTEGKVWNYMAHLPTGDIPFHLVINGDTVINNQNCKKVFLQTDQETWLYGCYYEKYGELTAWKMTDLSVDDGLLNVTKLQDVKSITLYAFPETLEWRWAWANIFESQLINHICVNRLASNYEQVHLNTYYHLYPIKVRNNFYDILSLNCNEKNELWASGIGSQHWGILEPDHEGNSNWLEFESCQENDKVIFRKKDFETPSLTMEYRPLIEDGKTWLCQGYKGGDVLTSDGYYLYTCYLKGDTVVGNRQCKKMYMYNNQNLGETRYEGAFYEESRRVYRFLPGQEDAQLMYDFSLDNGDETTVHCASTGSWHIRKVADVYQMYDGKPRHVTIFSEDEPTFKGYWMDGVGVLSRFCVMNPAGFSLLGGFWGAGVIECSINGEILYRSPDYSESLETEENDDYLPFVELGKNWHIVSSTYFQKEIKEVDYRIQQVEEQENIEGKPEGQTYMKLGGFLIREENRKVYIYEPNMNIEFLMFDFSLKEGDTYETFSYDEMRTVTYKVLSVGDFTGGPTITRYEYDEKADSVIEHQRYLRKWTVCRADNGYNHKTWIEGVGSLEGPFGNLSDDRIISMRSYLAYVLYDGQHDDYLPFSFYDDLNEGLVWTRGCKLPTGKVTNRDDGIDRLTYELEGNRLHIYGDVFSNCGPNHYIYFFEEPTDEPFVHKLHYRKMEVEPIATCAFLRATDFYVSGFDPNLNYVVVDYQGVEHPVINKNQQMSYRPFVEDDKEWVVRVYSDNASNDQYIEYLYFEGDTIINGQTAKRMLCDRVDSKYDTTGEYVGAWYEQDKKVYYAGNRQQQFKLLYDFTLSSGDIISISDFDKYVVDKKSGSIPGFKGTYYELGGEERWFEGVGSESWPFNNHPRHVVGHTGILLGCAVGDEIIYYNSNEDDPYIIGSRKNRFDFTHTIKIKPKTPTRREAAQSVYGEYNELKLGINLDPLDEAYLVRITDETGKVVYEKAINAGSIVGLNIDISAYPEGRYTVTVENSQEAFTGEFEMRATGISDAARLNDKEKRIKHIYNLQGQRLSSLQRGLNIMNGQKIYVK